MKIIGANQAKKTGRTTPAGHPAWSPEVGRDFLAGAFLTDGRADGLGVVEGRSSSDLRTLRGGRLSSTGRFTLGVVVGRVPRTLEGVLPRRSLTPVGHRRPHPRGIKSRRCIPGPARACGGPATGNGSTTQTVDRSPVGIPNRSGHSYDQQGPLLSASAFLETVARSSRDSPSNQDDLLPPIAPRRIEVRIVVDDHPEVRAGVPIRVPDVERLEAVAVVAKEPGVLVRSSHAV